MTHYVVGFYFSPGLDKVALIRKTRPAWQEGKLNGVGGHVEAGESPQEAMVREFAEETGHVTHRWHYYARMKGPDFTVDVFTVSGPLEKLKSTTEEKIEFVIVEEVGPLRNDVIENLAWLIGLALDHLVDGRPMFSEIKYP